MTGRPPGLTDLRGAWWAVRAARAARRSIARDGVASAPLPPVPNLPASAQRGVAGALRRGPYSCLERATVMQAWHAAHGRDVDVVVGVTGSRPEFRAHAWLDGDDACHDHEFRELFRLPAA